MDVLLISYLRSILPMERDKDTSGGIRRWEHALKGVWVEQFSADGHGAVTEPDKQVLIFAKAFPQEVDLLTA